MMGAGIPNPWGAAAAGNALDTGANPWATASGTSGAGGNPPNPFGVPGMPPGGAPNMDQMMAMLENPAMSQMMNDMVQNNPDMIRNMLEAQNPMMRQMFAGNPEMANDFIRNMFNPANMRNMMEMSRSMQQNGGGMPQGNPFAAMGAAGAGAGGMANPWGAMGIMPGAAPGGAGGEIDFSNLLQQFQQAGLNAGGAAPARPTNPADRYRNQLQSLYGMGFDDEQANLAALQANHGNLNRAVDQLLSAPAPAPESNNGSGEADNNDSNSNESGDKKE